MKKLLPLVLTALLLPSLSLAAGEARLYDVELLLFAHRDNASEELFEGEYFPAVDETAHDLERLTAPAIAPGPQSPVTPIAPQTLHGIRDTLDRRPGYRVLLHRSWRQYFDDSTTSAILHLHSTEDVLSQAINQARSQDLGWDVLDELSSRPGPLWSLDGSVRIELRRYLHLYTDLVYRQIEDAMAEDGPTLAIHHYPLKQHRRMRSQELHYLDHPAFGLLIEITPVES